MIPEFFAQFYAEEPDKRVTEDEGVLIVKLCDDIAERTASKVIGEVVESTYDTLLVHFTSKEGVESVFVDRNTLQWRLEY